MSLDHTIIPRHLVPEIREDMRTSPVTVLTGIRTVGKSTMLRSCAEQHGVPVIDLDDRDVLEQLRADPLPVLTGAEPVCIDEFQHDLDVLYRIKSQLNADMRPGRYLLTGSTRYSTLPRAAQALTGRAHVVSVWPLSQGELRGRREKFLETLLKHPERLREQRSHLTSRGEYIDAILAGGLPIALAAPSVRARERYFGDLLDLILLRDVLEIRKIRSRGVLYDLARHLTARTGQILNTAAIADAVGHEARTLYDYINLLESVFVLHRLDAYSRTLGGRLTKSPKVHLVDTGLAAHLLGINAERIQQRDPTALSQFGHLTETFVVNEVLKQAGWYEEDLRFSHLRTRSQRKVDLVIEARDGRTSGVEVKAGSTVKDADFAGLRMLRDRLGEEFRAGVLLNFGERSYQYEDRLYVAPLDTLWV